MRVLILPASPYDSLPDSLEEVLRSRPLTLAADGMLYRESLAEAAAELGMEVRRYPRKVDPTVLAAEAMGVDVAEVAAVIARFGREAGPPWRQDHKRAAAAALCVLGPRIRGRRSKRERAVDFSGAAYPSAAGGSMMDRGRPASWLPWRIVPRR